jgi:hypothetical protein
MLNQYPDFDVKHPFKTFNSSPYYDGRLNGYDVMIMQSDLYTNKIIEIFKERILNGENPNEIQDEVYAAAGVKDFNSDVLESDQRIIYEKVQKMLNLYALGSLS